MHRERGLELLVGEALGKSLGQALSRANGWRPHLLASSLEASPDAVLVVTTSECSPDECAGLVTHERDVVVLAALPSRFQERAYIEAGARAYIPMTIDIAPLVSLLEQAMGG